MAYKLGIIPAAGRAMRFKGTFKELLPIADGETLLTRTVAALRTVCDDLVIVTAPEKIGMHASIVEVRHALFVMQEQAADIWGAMLAGMRIEAGRYYFAMPDTLIPADAFKDVPVGHFCLGVFQTDTPERFGVLRTGHIVNKQPGAPGEAWGVLVWSREVRDYWMMVEFDSYTDAINAAMREFGYQTFELEYYFDNAAFTEYAATLRKVTEWQM